MKKIMTKTLETDLQLSIIVPVYNVEKYIRTCIESIFKQDMDENCFEVIIVNDGTEDHSMEVIQDVIDQHNNIIVINQENQGLSIARNMGMQYAKGQFLFFVDSDDLLVEKSILPILYSALAHHADMVVAGFYRKTEEEIMSSSFSLTGQVTFQQMSGTQMYQEFYNPYESYVWRSLYRREFLIENHLNFIPGIFYEDIVFTQLCYLKANICLQTNIPIYVYRIRHGSITMTMDKKKAKDLNTALGSLCQMKHSIPMSNDLLQKVENNIFTLLSFNLWCMSHDSPLRHCRKELIRDLKSKASAVDLWFNNTKKQLFVSFMFRYMPSLYLFLRSL